MTCQSSESTDAIDGDTRTDHRSRTGEPDQNRISLAMKELKSTGWYWGSLSATEASAVLRAAAEGTFLVRDSSRSGYLFTISAVTSVGPTNLRIELRQGKFSLDSVVLVRPRLQQFDSVVRLVQHYVHLSRTPPGARCSVPPNGTVQLFLTRPLYAAPPPPLQHLCRIAINRTSGRVRDLPLPGRLKAYLGEYAYDV